MGGFTADGVLPIGWATVGTGPATSGRVATYLLGPAAATLTATFDLRPKRRRVRDRGGVMLGAWSTPFEERAAGVLPDTPAHLVITPTHWIYAVASEGTMIPVKRGVFLRRLTGMQSASVSIGDGYAVLTLPNGKTIEVAHAHIAREHARQSCFELYQEDAAVDAEASFLAFTAD
jgi:hypothetical protein